MEENITQEKVSKHRRYLKNYLIYPRFQLGLVFANCLILLSAFVVIYYQVQNSFYQLDEVARAQNITAGPFYKELVMYQEQFILSKLYISMIVSLVIVFVFTIVFTHRSAGAVYALKKYFQEISQDGFKRPLTFRKKDMHKELPSIVNAAIARIMNDKNNKE